MIYYLFYELIYGRFKDQDWWLVKVLNVFQYVTFRTAYATVTALLITLLFGGKAIEALKKWNIGQQIREEGPQAHIAKRDTPTMGGLLVIASVVISTLLWARLSSFYVWVIIAATLAFGAIGFADDYLKLVKRRSLGLTARQKLGLQLLIAFGVWLTLYLSTRYFETKYSWNVSIPFFKDTAVPNGISTIGPIVYLLLIVIVLLGATNAVNLTDGLDGLATGSACLVLAAYVLIGNWQLRNDCTAFLAPHCYAVRDPLDLAVVAAAVLGACFGFLWWNAPPARIFMGDTGSLALGGVLAGLAVCTKTQLLLAILGGLFVVIALSVIIQVGSFKMTGRRVFRMAPLQHHFELLGWAETTIVIRFWLICGLFVALGLGIFYVEWMPK